MEFKPRSHVGDLLNGRFKIVKKLADTLQGYIYLAEDISNENKKKVIKEAFIALIEDNKSRDGHPVHEDFEHEKYLLKYLSTQPDADAGFTRIVSDWQTEYCYYYAMEFCEAELFKFISNAFAQGGAMFDKMQKEKNKPQVALKKNDAYKFHSEVRSIFRQCVKAVHYFHEKGVCHLDLSLENTMIYKVEGLKIKVIDFGLGKKYDYKNPNKPKDALFQNQERVGKRGYMAPEVYNKMIYDARKADIWCLGVMLFMMAIGAPPYKRATQRDAAFNYIINGMLEDVLKHWKRLTLISEDCLDCMLKIFRWEKDRIDMKKLIAHPFVDLESEIEESSADTGNSFNRIQEALTQYHKEYAVATHLHQEGDSQNGNDSADNQLITIQTMVESGAKYKLPTFASVADKAMTNGAVRLLDDFRFTLQNIKFPDAVQPEVATTESMDMNVSKDQKAKPNKQEEEQKEKESKDEGKEFDAVYRQMVDGMRGNPFIGMQNSMILRRCFRDRKKCEDEKGLLEVYGKDSRVVVKDDKQRMTMQIMDKVYCYFAYAHDLGFVMREEEVDEITKAVKGQNANADVDRALLKVKGLMQMKKQKMMKSKYGKQIYEVLARRKVKFSTSSANFMAQQSMGSPASVDVRSGKSLTWSPSFKVFEGIKDKMQSELVDLKSNPETMNHAEFMRFILGIRARSRRDKQHQLHLMSSEQWEKLKSTLESVAVDETYFLKMSRKEYAKMLDKQLPRGVIIKVKKEVSSELKEVAKRRFTSKKEKVVDCNVDEVTGLMLNVMRRVLNIDVENDVDADKLKEICTASKIDGKTLLSLDEEFIISNLLLPCLRKKYGNLDAHRLGKRYRYWPAYGDNGITDLYNGGPTQQWYAKPKFTDIKDEVLNNPLAKITVNQWNRTVLYASKVVIKTSAIKALRAEVPTNLKKFGATSNSSFHKYGVKNGDKIRLEHLVPLLIFIDLDFVSKAVVESCNNNNWRDGHSEEMKEMVQRSFVQHHANVAQISRLIRETVECYGTRWGSEEDGNTPTFYHLLDKDIVPSSLDMRFFSPLSVTTKLNAALVMNDFNENEVVLQLKCAPNSKLRYFDCSWISEYPLEGEHIACGGLGTASICNIYDLCAGMRYDYHVVAMKLFMAVISGGMLPKVSDSDLDLVAQALSSMMGDQTMKVQRQQGGGDDVDDSKSDDSAFINDTFGAMCNVTRYVQLNLVDIKKSELLSGMLYGGNMIGFRTLGGVLPNCRRYFVSLKGIDAEETQGVLYNAKFIKNMTKMKFGEIMETITFGVDGKMKIDLSKYAECGWTASTASVGGEQFVKLQKIEKKDIGTQ